MQSVRGRFGGEGACPRGLGASREAPLPLGILTTVGSEKEPWREKVEF